jgi:hypothetical protein
MTILAMCMRKTYGSFYLVPMEFTRLSANTHVGGLVMHGAAAQAGGESAA